MKRFLLVLTIACMHKTIHAMQYQIQQGDHQGIIEKYFNPSSENPGPGFSSRVLESGLFNLMTSIEKHKKSYRDSLKGCKHQDTLAHFTPQTNLFIKHLTTYALLKVVKIVPKQPVANPYYAPFKKPIDSKETVLESLMAAIDNQDYDSAARTLQDNKLYRLLLFEKIPLMERARAYEFVNDLKTERSIKLKFKHSDENKKPDPRFAVQRETSKDIVQLLQTRLYRNIKAN